MSPTVLRVSGPDFTNKYGAEVKPRAMIHFCEGCHTEGAAFGIKIGGKLFSFCGWRNGAPFCRVHPDTHVPQPGDTAPDQSVARHLIDRTV